MLRLILSQLIIIGLLSTVKCDVIRLGRCPMIKVQKDFAKKLFTGDWFEVFKNPILVLTNTKCNKMNLQYDEQYFQMRSSSVHKSFNREVAFEAYAIPNKDSPAELTIKYPLTLFKTNITIPYWIIYTDYQTALVWSCFEYLKLFHLEYFWILSRKPYLSDDKVNDLLEILTFSGIKTDYGIKIDQVGCT